MPYVAGATRADILDAISGEARHPPRALPADELIEVLKIQDVAQAKLLFVQ